MLCDLELQDLRGFIFTSMYDSIEFRNWMSLNSRVQWCKYSNLVLLFYGLTHASTFQKSVYVVY